MLLELVLSSSLQAQSRISLLWIFSDREQRGVCSAETMGLGF